MQSSCVSIGKQADGLVDPHDDEDPIGAMDTGPINLRLALKKIEIQDYLESVVAKDLELCNELFGDESVSSQDIRMEMQWLLRYFEAAKRMINASHYGFSEARFKAALKKAEPDLGDVEYRILCALGVLGKRESSCHLSMYTVYIDIDSTFIKKS